jgi:hypothetical protein
MKANNNGWTLERRAKQSAMMHQWKPWKQSTGAKTKEGMDKSKMNAMRITPQGLLRRMNKLVMFRGIAESNNGNLPPSMVARYNAFTTSLDCWLQCAPTEHKPK